MATNQIQKTDPQQIALARQQQQSKVLTILKTSELREVYTLMSSGKAIKEMTNEELVAAVKKITSAISAITGSGIEQGMEITTLKMLKVFLHKHFSFLTTSEIIYAFEHNALQPEEKHIKHYNKAINLDFVGRILRNYVDFRTEQVPEISQAIAHVSRQIEYDRQNNWSREVTDDDRKTMLNESYLSYKVNPKMGLLFAVQMYDYAEKFELIPVGEWQKRVTKAISSLRTKTALRIDPAFGNDKREKFNKHGESIGFDVQESGHTMELKKMNEVLSSQSTQVCMNLYGTAIVEEAKGSLLKELYDKKISDNKENIFE